MPTPTKNIYTLACLRDPIDGGIQYAPIDQMEIPEDLYDSTCDHVGIIYAPEHNPNLVIYTAKDRLILEAFEDGKNHVWQIIEQGFDSLINTAEKEHVSTMKFEGGKRVD